SVSHENETSRSWVEVDVAALAESGLNTLKPKDAPPPSIGTVGLATNTGPTGVTAADGVGAGALCAHVINGWSIPSEGCCWGLPDTHGPCAVIDRCGVADDVSICIVVAGISNVTVRTLLMSVAVITVTDGGVLAPPGLVRLNELPTYC